MSQANPFNQQQDALRPLEAPGSTGTPRNLSAGDPAATFDAPGTAGRGIVAGYMPQQRTLDAGTQTVEGRIGNIVKSGNPLLEQARTSAKEQANARGLVNSSMAVQAGELATYSAALPIAQADAAITNDMANRNMDAANSAGQLNTTARNQMSQQVLQGDQQSQLLAQKAQIDKDLLEKDTQQKQVLLQAQAGFDTAMQGLRGTQAQQLAETEASYKTLMQTNDSAGKLFQQQIDAINKVLTSDLDATAKQSAVDNINAQLKNGLTIIGKISNIPNLPDLLTFNGPAVPSSSASGSSNTAANQPGSQGIIDGSESSDDE